MSDSPEDNFLNAPVNPEIAASKEELMEQRTGTALAVIYADSIAARFPVFAGEANAARMAAEKHIDHIDKLLQPGHERTLLDEFLVAERREGALSEAADLVIAVAQKGPKPG